MATPISCCFQISLESSQVCTVNFNMFVRWSTHWIGWSKSRGIPSVTDPNKLGHFIVALEHQARFARSITSIIIETIEKNVHFKSIICTLVGASASCWTIWRYHNDIIFNKTKYSIYVGGPTSNARGRTCSMKIWQMCCSEERVLHWRSSPWR